ncbi:hypothetical protein [Dyella psychrodurans]|uniref:Uncharacterized protein n=1 Tax=Dyella psychrodurans TaxID=1927960 RepID=A0A370X0M1_9GAMM|nr:hypothetical protein [Dyella psychrodurans]RDS81949.1 hypothetical protein DWU99_16160 [Dyella psychrodurans]
MGLPCAWLAAMACVSQPLRAQSSTVSGAVAVSSQLVDRGLAITPTTPILQAASSWTSASGWSLGVSGATEIRSPGHFSEAMAQVSRDWSLSSDWQMQAGALYYDYPGNAQARLFDRTEIGLNWIYRDILTFGLSAICLTNGTHHVPRGAADIDFHWPLAWHFSLSMGVGVAQKLIQAYESYGYNNRLGTGVYRYGHAGLLWSYGPWRVELDRIATNPVIPRRSGSLVAQPWVGTVSWSF